jgi:hypothetical protein
MPVEEDGIALTVVGNAKAALPLLNTVSPKPIVVD